MKLSWCGDEIANTSFRGDVRKQNLRLGELSALKQKNNNKSNLSRSSTVTSMLQLNCNVLTIMQYVHCLRNVLNQSTAICRQIVCVDIEVEYFRDNIIYHYPTSVRIFL